MRFVTRTRPGVVDASSYRDELRSTIAQAGDIVVYNRTRYRVLTAGMKVLRLEGIDNPSDKPTVFRKDCYKEQNAQPPSQQTL